MKSMGRGIRDARLRGMAKECLTVGRGGQSTAIERRVPPSLTLEFLQMLVDASK